MSFYQSTYQDAFFSTAYIDGRYHRVLTCLYKKIKYDNIIRC